MGYPPIKQSIKIIKKAIAVVEKFAGKINANVIAIGNHNCKTLSLKVISLSFFLAKYLET